MNSGGDDTYPTGGEADGADDGFVGGDGTYPTGDDGTDEIPYGTGDATLEMGTLTNLDHNLQTVNLG